jgi:hypothetical protein
MFLTLTLPKAVQMERRRPLANLREERPAG